MQCLFATARPVSTTFNQILSHGGGCVCSMKAYMGLPVTAVAAASHLEAVCGKRLC